MADYRERDHRGNRPTGSRGMGRSSRERARIAARRRKLRRRRRMIQIAMRIGVLAAAVFAVVLITTKIGKPSPEKGTVSAAGLDESGGMKGPVKVVQTPPDYDVQLLTVNEYSRPGTPIDEVKGIVVHYTANPGTTAMQNRSYFEGLKDSHATSASSHFIIGMDGELVQCIPCNEVAYASNDRNNDTISIECCIPDDTGKFTDDTYDTLVHLIAWLCGRYGLTTEQVIRHYDITGKMCPKYYVEHEDEWDRLKRDVWQYIEDYGVLSTETAQFTYLPMPICGAAGIGAGGNIKNCI